MWRAEGTWTSWERKSEEERSNPEATSSSCHANEAFLQELDWSNLYLDISDGSEVLRDLEFFLLVPLQPSNNHHGGSAQTVAGASVGVSVGVADTALEVDEASSSLRDRPHNEHDIDSLNCNVRCSPANLPLYTIKAPLTLMEAEQGCIRRGNCDGCSCGVVWAAHILSKLMRQS